MRKSIVRWAPNAVVSYGADGTALHQGYSGKIVAVDIHIYAYKYCATDRDPAQAIVMQATWFRTVLGMEPVYFFDGAPREAKAEEHEKRRGMKRKAAEALAEAEACMVDGIVIESRSTRGSNDSTESTESKESMSALDTLCAYTERIDTLRKRVYGLPQRGDIQRMWDALRTMYPPVACIREPGDGEGAAARYVRRGDAAFVASEDFDVLAYGAPLLTGVGSGSGDMYLYDHDGILKEMGMSRNTFVDFCILCGCDLSNKIRGVGPVAARKMLLAHETIEGVLANLHGRKGQYVVPDPFRYNQARHEFEGLFVGGRAAIQ